MSRPAAVTSTTVETSRLETHVLESGSADGEAVLLLHGNASSARFYAELMAALPDRYHAIAPDFRGFGQSERKPIDATRGLRDFAEDVRALVEALDIESPTLVGWSTGGGVAMRYAIEHPDAVRNLVFFNPVSPYGYGGVHRDGTPCQPDYAGTGAGMANDDFVARLEDGDRSGEAEASPRNVMKALYMAPGSELDSDVEDDYVDALVEMEVGEQYYPGDSNPSEHWPGVAPGESGVNNALSPTYFDATSLVDIDPKAPILWVRGSEDQIVSDTALLDTGYLGQIGELPGWPGEEEYPPQPMVTQTRDVFEEYEQNGGRYEEVVVDGVGHSPHIEKQDEVLSTLTEFLSQ